MGGGLLTMSPVGALHCVGFNKRQVEGVPPRAYPRLW